MKTKFSKSFIKAAQKLSGKHKHTLNAVITEVEKAKSVSEVTDCKKLIGYENIYRIRFGSYRAIFLLQIIEDTVLFQYLVSRGEAYKKEISEHLKKKDK